MPNDKVQKIPTVDLLNLPARQLLRWQAGDFELDLNLPARRSPNGTKEGILNF